MPPAEDDGPPAVAADGGSTGSATDSPVNAADDAEAPVDAADDADEAAARPERSAVLKSLAGFLVAGVLLYLGGRVVGWGEILAALGGADPALVGLACASSLACLLVWAKGWDLVLAAVGVDIPYREVVPVYYAATFADYVTPFGKVGGNPFVAWVLSRDRRASYAEGLAGVVAADSLNLLPFFTLAGAGVVVLGFTEHVPDSITPLVAALGAMGFAVPLVALGIWHHREPVIAGLDRVLSPLADRVGHLDADRVEDRIREFYDLLDRIGASRSRLVETLGVSYTGWVLFAAPLWLAAQSLGVGLDPLLVAFVVPASTLASFVPTPSGVGGVEAAVTGLLVALAGLSPGTAAAVAILYRVASYWVPLAVAGVVSLLLLYRR